MSTGELPSPTQKTPGQRLRTKFWHLTGCGAGRGRRIRSSRARDRAGLARKATSWQARSRRISQLGSGSDRVMMAGTRREATAMAKRIEVEQGEQW
jgi:hypothetical protein